MDIYNQNEPQQKKPLPPNNYLALAILTTIFCCLPLGIVSILYSAKVNNLWAWGYYDEAQKTALKAKKWAIAAVIVAILAVLLYFLLIVIGFVAGNALMIGSELIEY